MSRKGLRITYWVFTILFALFMFYSGVSGIIGSEDGNKVILDLGYPLYINFILGIGKILGSLAIIQTKWVVIKEWAYAGFTFDIIGASLSFAFAGIGFSASFMPLIFLVIMFVSYGLWIKLN